MLKSAITGLRTISVLRTRADSTNQDVRIPSYITSSILTVPNSSQQHDFSTSYVNQQIKLCFKRSEYTDNPFIPSFQKIASEASFNIYGNDISTFCGTISSIYEEIKFWNKNLFSVPSGNASKHFIELLNYWLDQYNKDTPLSNIALKVFMVLPNLILQKPSKSSKVNQHIKLMNERMEKFECGNIEEIFREGKTIQHKLCNGKKSPESVSKLFVRFLLLGKVNSATRLLEEGGSQGVLPLNEENLNLLKLKHPIGEPAFMGSLLFGPINDVPKTFFDNIDGAMIETAIKRTNGASGPSHIDGDFFRQVTSRKFRKEGSVLKHNIATLARKIATEKLDPHALECYTSCRLIPLDKNPGLRPIGIGETLRRIIGKAVSWIIKPEAMLASGPLQVAAGLKSGAEAAIHAMRQMYEDDDTEALILVDANNAFNKMNRIVALHNVQVICPEIAQYLINTYRNPSRLIITGDTNNEILSLEGTTQGDNLAMIFYALGITPIVRGLGDIDVRQCWLADDATAVGKVQDLREWWDKLVDLGIKHGYFVNESKTWIIVKNEDSMNKVTEIFGDTKIKYTMEGKRHLGACIGSEIFKDSYCKEKVEIWCKEMERLCEIAQTNPQAAYSAYIKSYQHKFTYFFRTIPNFEKYLKPLDDLITYGFLPTLFGSAITPLEREIFALPTRYGGLGVSILADKAPKITQHLYL